MTLAILSVQQRRAQSTVKAIEQFSHLLFSLSLCRRWLVVPFSNLRGSLGNTFPPPTPVMIEETTSEQYDALRREVMKWNVNIFHVEERAW